MAKPKLIPFKELEVNSLFLDPETGTEQVALGKTSAACAFTGMATVLPKEVLLISTRLAVEAGDVFVADKPYFEDSSQRSYPINELLICSGRSASSLDKTKTYEVRSEKLRKVGIGYQIEGDDEHKLPNFVAVFPPGFEPTEKDLEVLTQDKEFLACKTPAFVVKELIPYAKHQELFTIEKDKVIRVHPPANETLPAKLTTGACAKLTKADKSFTEESVSKLRRILAKEDFEIYRRIHGAKELLDNLKLYEKELKDTADLESLYKEVERLSKTKKLGKAQSYLNELVLAHRSNKREWDKTKEQLSLREEDIKFLKGGKKPVTTIAKELASFKKLVDQGVIEAFQATDKQAVVILGPTFLTPRVDPKSHPIYYMGRIRVMFHAQADCTNGRSCRQFTTELISYTSGRAYHPHAQGQSVSCTGGCWGSYKNALDDYERSGNVVATLMLIRDFYSKIHEIDQYIRGFEKYQNMKLDQKGERYLIDGTNPTEIWAERQKEREVRKSLDESAEELQSEVGA